MKINSAEMVMSAVKAHQYPEDDKPEFALAGRSNVGKSSLINAILNRRKLARTSSSPGKTQTLNFYHINDAFYFVDVPGYGYAKVSKKQREEFGVMIEGYLTTRKQLRGMVLLVDSRHLPTEDDKIMFEYAQYIGKPILVVATKIDKIKPSQHNKVLKNMKSELDLSDPNVTFLTFSAETKFHVEEFWQWIEANM